MVWWLLQYNKKKKDRILKRKKETIFTKILKLNNKLEKTKTKEKLFDW